MQEDLDVMEPLAAQLAISVANARLFEKVRQQTIELEGRVLERTAEIRRQQERTEAIIGSVADAVIVFDLDGQVMMMNPVARALFDQHDLDMDLSTRISALVTRALAQDGATPNLTEVIESGAVALQVKAARVVDGEASVGCRARTSRSLKSGRRRPVFRNGTLELPPRCEPEALPGLCRRAARSARRYLRL